MAIEVSSQYKYTGRGPLDSKTLVKTYADLLKETTWHTEDNKVAAYNGMIVAVWLDTDSTKNGAYFLYDASVTSTFKAPDITKEANWHRLDNTEAISELTSKLRVLEAGIDENTQALNDEISARESADFTILSKIGEVSAGKTIVDLINEAIQKAKDYADENDANTVYDDTELKTRIKSIEEDYLKEADVTDIETAYKTADERTLDNAKTYIDNQITGLASTTITTDKLVNGSETLVFCCGNAIKE